MTYKGKLLYMDATDFEHETGQVTVQVYPSIKALKTAMPCVSECGIVAVRIELVKVVKKGKPYSERGLDNENS